MMTSITTLVVLGIVLIGADGNDCIIHDNEPIKNCCNLGFGHSKFREVINKPKVYNVKDFCYGTNCQSTLSKVYCDTLTAGGGWTVIQRRIYGRVEFKKRDWVEYEEGFGDLTGEFWYGLHSIHCMTRYGRWELRIDFNFTNGTKSHLSYKQFAIGPAEDQYPLSISGFDSIRLNDPFNYGVADRLNGMKFSSYDYDNDLSSNNCAAAYGGWWYRACSRVFLNQDYNMHQHNISQWSVASIIICGDESQATELQH